MKFQIVSIVLVLLTRLGNLVIACDGLQNDDQTCSSESSKQPVSVATLYRPNMKAQELISKVAYKQGTTTAEVLIESDKERLFERFKSSSAVILFNTLDGKFVNTVTGTSLRHCLPQPPYKCTNYIVVPLNLGVNSSSLNDQQITAYFGNAPTFPVQCSYETTSYVSYDAITGGQLTGTSAYSLLTCGGERGMLPNGTLPFTSQEYSADTLGKRSVLIIFANPGVCMSTVSIIPHWAPQPELLYEALEIKLDKEVESSKAVLSYPSIREYEGSPVLNVLSNKLIGIVGFSYTPGLYEDTRLTAGKYVTIPVSSIIDTLGRRKQW